MRRRRTVKQELIEEAQARLARARAKSDADLLALRDGSPCVDCDGEGWRMLGEPTVCRGCCGTGEVPARVRIEVVDGGVVARGHHAGVSFMAALAASKALDQAIALCIPQGIILRSSDVDTGWLDTRPITALWWSKAERARVPSWAEMRGD